MLYLDDVDKAILNTIQNHFPVAVQPYQEMATRLDISEEELIKRIAVMKEAGLIRRIGGVIDSRKLGFYSTLCAMVVPGDRVESVAQIVNSFSGVTHNYLRDYRYNLWFTLTAPEPETALNIIRDIEQMTGLKVVSMPARKVYKIKVSFDMEGSNAI